MNRLLPVALIFLLFAGGLPLISPVHAQGQQTVSVDSQYVLNRYGYAIVNETVSLTNNGSSAIQVPDMQFGLGAVSSLVSAYNVTGTGYSVSRANGSQGEVFTVSGGGQSLGAGKSGTYSFKVLLGNAVSKIKNGSLGVMLLTRPFLGFHADSLKLVIRMPGSTELKAIPTDYKGSFAGSNITYSRILSDVSSQPALTEFSLVQQSSTADFHPLEVYSASRQVTVAPNGSPQVRDTVFFKNIGTSQLDTLVVATLAAAGDEVTVLPSTSPPLLNPATIPLTGGGIDLTNSAIGLPVDADANLTITYQYPLAQKFYSVAGGVVNVTIPTTPPIPATVESYSIGMTLPPGVGAVQSAPQTLKSVNLFQSGTAHFAYGLSVGWALDSAVPAASFLFVLALIGVFAVRTTASPETEEEKATEGVADMIKAFEEKTSLINGLFEEIPEADPNQMGKAYFDELRGRVDTFRGRALQRLNEIKQRSTTQKFSELLGQVHETEREVDRAAKDLLNLHEQFYTKRMRREVFERLLPSYKRRLEKALNQLSDELNVAQRESKTL